MRTITAVESITIDGVMQAPGGADEDMRGDFRHGGWARPYVVSTITTTTGVIIATMRPSEGTR